MPLKEAKRTKEAQTLDTDDCVDSGVAEKNAMQDLAPTWVVESPCEPMPCLDKNSTTETSELSPTDNEKQLQRDLVKSFPMDKQSLDIGVGLAAIGEVDVLVVKEDEHSVQSEASSDEDDLSENMTLAELTDNNLRSESPEGDQSEKADTLDFSVVSSAGETMDSCQESGPLAVQEIPKDACLVCGKSLQGWGHVARVNHLKRCSRKYGVVARDQSVNDDKENFVGAPSTTTTLQSSNPYIQGQSTRWHAGAEQDLDLASHSQKEPSSSSSSKQTTMSSFLQMPVRNLNKVLLAGARRLAVSTAVMSSHKESQPRNRNGRRRQKRKRFDFSNVSPEQENGGVTLRACQAHGSTGNLPILQTHSWD